MGKRSRDEEEAVDEHPGEGSDEEVIVKKSKRSEGTDDEDGEQGKGEAIQKEYVVESILARRFINVSSSPLTCSDPTLLLTGRTL